MVKKHYSSWKTLMEKGIHHIAAAIMEQACQNRSIRLNTIEKLTMLLIIKLQYHFYLLFVSDINLYFYIFHRFFLNKLYQIHFKLGFETLKYGHLKWSKWYIIYCYVQKMHHVSTAIYFSILQFRIQSLAIAKGKQTDFIVKKSIEFIYRMPQFLIYISSTLKHEVYSFIEAIFVGQECKK